MANTTTIEQQGRRLYFRGAPYEARTLLRDAGAKWDPAERAWWMGSTRRAAAEVLLARVSAAGSDALDPEARVVRGRATYEGRGYLLLARGVSVRTGRPYAKLAHRDGSRVFWAARPEDVAVQKEYREPLSIADLDSFAERARREEAEGAASGYREECFECGAIYTRPGCVWDMGMSCRRCG